MTDTRKIKSLQHRIHKHAKDHCANHKDVDKCLLTDNEKCVLSFKGESVTGNICPYFVKHVAPSSPRLLEEYSEHLPDGHELKKDKKEFPNKCSRCYQRYKKTSNRQKYCDKCRPIVQQKQAKERMKVRRKAAVTNQI